MSWYSALAIYMLFWVFTLFLVLPYGVRTSRELGEAQVPLTLAADALESGQLEERGERVPTEEAYWICAPAPQWKSAKVKALVEQLLGG